MAADRPWYRQVTTGYVVQWGDDYLSFSSETARPVWLIERTAAIKMRRADAFAVLRDMREHMVTGKIRVLRRYKVIP